MVSKPPVMAAVHLHQHALAGHPLPAYTVPGRPTGPMRPGATKRVDRAIAVIWKMLMVAEKRFRRLQAPELMKDVYLGARYLDGIAIEATAEKVAA